MAKKMATGFQSFHIVPNPAAKSNIWKHFGFLAAEDESKITRKHVFCCICVIGMHVLK
jgi:hypothetical protein